MFVFLIGILGVLSMFPVAMNSASRTMGQVRGNILAQSVLAQLTADCKVPYATGVVDVANTNATTLGAQAAPGWAVDEWNGYYVTITSGTTAKWQSRRIIRSTVLDTGTVALTDANPATLTDTTKALVWVGGLYNGHWLRAAGETRLITNTIAGTLTVSPAFSAEPPLGTPCEIISSDSVDISPNWTVNPANDDGFVITRLGLPDGPLPGTLGEFGLERDFYVRRIIDAKTIEIGRRDTLEPTSGIVTAQTANTLTDNTQNSWADDIYINCTVLLTSGRGAGQQRLITDNDDAGTLTVAPAWDVPPEVAPNPDQTSYEILSINPVKYYSDTVPVIAASGSQDLTDNDDAVTWQTNELVDHLIRVTDVTTGGVQVRRIRSNTADTLTVSSPWTADIAVGDNYEIGWPDSTLDGALGGAKGFLVITSGRSAGRVYQIDTYDFNTGQISCIGADLDFREIGVNEAEVPIDDSAYPANDSHKYKPADATTVTVIGNSGHLQSVLPVAQDRTLRLDEADPKDDEINVFGQTTKTQTKHDVFGSADDEYGSEYSAVAIFGDSGTLPEGPVRVDVLVFRNFDNAQNLADNRKPVGFLTGYIGRP